MKTSIDIQVEYSGQWHSGELTVVNGRSPVVLVAGETEGRGPDDVCYIRSDGDTDEILLGIAGEAGFNVIEG